LYLLGLGGKYAKDLFLGDWRSFVLSLTQLHYLALISRGVHS